VSPLSKLRLQLHAKRLLGKYVNANASVASNAKKASSTTTTTSAFSSSSSSDNRGKIRFPSSESYLKKPFIGATKKAAALLKNDTLDNNKSLASKNVIYYTIQPSISIFSHSSSSKNANLLENHAHNYRNNTTIGTTPTLIYPTSPSDKSSSSSGTNERVHYVYPVNASSSMINQLVDSVSKNVQ